MAYPYMKHMIVFNDDFSHQKDDHTQQISFNRSKRVPVEDDEDMILESMIHNNKIECLYEVFKSEEPEQIELKQLSPRKEKKTKTKKTRASEDASKPTDSDSVSLYENPKTVETLLEYLKPESLDRIRLDFEEIYTSIFKRLKPFAAYVLENKERIEEIIDTFISRMILLLLPQDKQGVKLEKIMRDIEKMHHIRDKRHILLGKNDFENYDEVNLMRSERGLASLSPETDPIAIKFSAKRKRGRRNKTSSEARLNELESLNGDYITPKKSASKTDPNEDTQTAANAASLPEEMEEQEEDSSGQKSDVIDYHPIFTQILVTLNKSLPKVNNHGWFLYNTMRGIRELNNKDWPLRELMKVANNMQYCIKAERVTLPVYDENAKRHYCAFSGLPLHSGEVVTLVKMVELSAVRYLKEPEEEKILIDRAFESPEFKDSIRCFYMKTEICCPTALNYTDFDEEYKNLFPSHFGLNSNTPRTKKVKIEEKEDDDDDEEEKTREKKKRKTKDTKKEEKEHPQSFHVPKEKKKEEEIREKKKRKPKESKKEEKEHPQSFRVPKDNERKMEKEQTFTFHVTKQKSLEPKKPLETKKFKKTHNTTEKSILIDFTSKDDDGEECLIVNSERIRSREPVWHLMLALYKKISTAEERAAMVHGEEEEYKKNYASERANFFKIFGNINETNFKPYFDKLLLYCIKTSEPYPKKIDENALILMLFNVILDFVNALFQVPHQGKSKDPNHVIRNLFTLSDERDRNESIENRASFEPKKRPHLFNHYPFIFLILFDYFMEKKQFELIPSDWKEFAYNPDPPVDINRLLKRLNISCVV